MRFFVLFALLSMVACDIGMFDSQLDEYWKMFKDTFKKSYDGQEEVIRRLIWERNVAEIFRHNLRANLGLHSYTKGLNKYSDWSREEHLKMLCGFKISANFTSTASSWLPPQHVQIPDKVDWRTEGFVTPVKDQKTCGSCWAFSATGALEGQQKKKSGKLVSLSEQNLIDCSEDQGNKGCNGGWPFRAFEYVKQNHGIATEKSYPYKAEEQICHYEKSKKGATCTGYIDIPEGDELGLKQAVATVGPIAVAINALDGFMNYKSGIYFDTPCDNGINDLNHAVLVVGYGTEDGKDYWLVKNSWASSWGEEGYVRMARNKNNMCGIATRASYPLM